jgi:anionic cell wall polymer biosynthesis LytR-Cps2A-Psr (LCP) family protein
VLTLLSLVLGWLALSLILFLVSSHFERTSLPGDVASVLDPAGYPLTSANNILVLGSDRRQKDSKEPGAETTGFGRSDTIMLIRTGGGHAARLSIPRDTIVEIPGHGLQKINAAHE